MADFAHGSLLTISRAYFVGVGDKIGSEDAKCEERKE